MRPRRAISAAACVLAAAVAGGCATPGYDGGRVQSELVEAGTTRAQAECVTTKLTDTFDDRQLGSHSEPSAVAYKLDPKDKNEKAKSEYERVRDILHECGVTLPLNPLPSAPSS